MPLNKEIKPTIKNTKVQKEDLQCNLDIRELWGPENKSLISEFLLNPSFPYIRVYVYGKLCYPWTYWNSDF